MKIMKPDFDGLNELAILRGPVASVGQQIGWVLVLAGVVLACALLHWLVNHL